LKIRVPGNGLESAGNDRSGSVIAAHRVQGDPHGLLLLCDHNLATLVMPAVGAYPVRKHRFIAPAAVLNLNWLQMQMAPPLALTGVRRAPLGNSHESLPFRDDFEVKRVILGS
jgi:hypothetical protein